MSAIVELIKSFIKSSNHTAESYEEFKTNLERLINIGKNVNEPNDYSYSALHYAAKLGGIKLVDILLDKGADIEQQNCFGQTPLHDAARAGNIDVVERLINKGADIEQQNCFGQTPLHDAARAGNIDVVERLINKGADINHQDKNGQTPLWIAAFKKYTGVVAILLSKGASSKEALICAAQPKHNNLKQIFEILLKNGLEYIECIKWCRNISNSESVHDTEKAVLEIIATYASRRKNKIIACFTLALLASLAIAAIGVLAVCGIMSCSWIICFAVAIVAIVSCVSSLVFLHLLDQQNTERQERTSQHNAANPDIGQTDKTSRQKWLLTACVVLQVSAVVSAALCPPLCLVVIGILSISLLGISFNCRTPDEMPGIMQKVQSR